VNQMAEEIKKAVPEAQVYVEMLDRIGALIINIVGELVIERKEVGDIEELINKIDKFVKKIVKFSSPPYLRKILWSKKAGGIRVGILLEWRVRVRAGCGDRWWSMVEYLELDIRYEVGEVISGGSIYGEYLINPKLKEDTKEEEGLSWLAYLKYQKTVKIEAMFETAEELLSKWEEFKKRVLETARSSN